jgi:hypothetical protein
MRFTWTVTSGLVTSFGVGEMIRMRARVNGRELAVGELFAHCRKP